jgi:hypothetical protein
MRVDFPTKEDTDMSDGAPGLPPLSEVARIDGEIAECVHRAFSATASGADMGRLNALIRERAEASLPQALVARVRVRRERTWGRSDMGTPQ